VAELFRRIHNGKIGIVSTAFLADATPAALIAHTRSRNLAAQIVDSYLHGNTNFSWTHWDGPDVLFGGGAENFFAGPTSFKNQDYYKLFGQAGYTVSFNNTALQKIDTNKRALGLFSVSNMVSFDLCLALERSQIILGEMAR
jgi:alkaline phosphatase